MRPILPRFAAGFAATAALFAPTLAHAGWEWADWNMSPDAVVAASKGQVARSEPTPSSRVHGYDRLVQGEILRDGVRLKAQFYFSDAGLRVIRLVAVDVKDCGVIRKAWTKRLGAPHVESGLPQDDTPYLTWADDGKGNFTSLLETSPRGTYPGLCFVRLRPVAEAK